MPTQNSNVMEEFFKIMAEQDLVKTAAEKNPYAEDDKTIREKRLPASEKSIIEEAHPDPVFVADSHGEGGLVENEIEHQKKMIDIVNKMPTGSLVGRYSKAINELIKLANDCDVLGQFEAADLLTAMAHKALAEQEDALTDEDEVSFEDEDTSFEDLEGFEDFEERMPRIDDDEIGEYFEKSLKEKVDSGETMEPWEKTDSEYADEFDPEFDEEEGEINPDDPGLPLV